jgi:hypothetical protein
MKTRILNTVAGLCVFAASSAFATQIHLYEFNGNYNDSYGGSAIVGNGGSLAATTYNFGANQGLSLSGALPVSTYTIDTSFILNSTGGFRKLVDFKNLGSDAGLYDLNGSLSFYNFYPVVTGPDQIAQGQSVRMTLTRDGATSEVTGYVDGVLSFSFNDGGSAATFDQLLSIGNFFRDDFVTSGGESSAGSVDYIAIYDTALARADVALLNGDGPQGRVPEPETLALFASGLIGFMATRRRKRQL